MKRVVRFLRQYRLFSLVALALVLGLALEINHQHTAAHWLLGTVAIIELLPLLWSMWRDLQSGTYGIDILAATAIATSVLLHEYWAAIVVVLMLTGGEALEDFAEHRAKSELDALIKKAPQTAHVIRKGKTLEVSVDQIHVGERLLIKPGELVPVDAVVIEGAANFDESSLTGEALPVAKIIQDRLLSGSINLDGAVTAKATATAADSQYQQIIKLVRSAAASQAPFVRLADRYSLPFTLIAYAIAIGVWVLSGDAIRFLEVIIVATPCPLLLAAPIALISGMGRASKYGIIVKTGSALERLAEAKAIAFDKTGTLTTGNLAVEKVASYGSFNNDAVLGLAASLEQNSNHIVAEAIVNQALSQKIKTSKAKHVIEISGRGLKATVNRQEVLIGRLGLLKEENVTFPARFKADSFNQTAVYVSVGGDLAGVITFTDAVREEAKATLDQIRKLGINEIYMVTGDNKATASAIAKTLGINHVHSEMLPADKLRVLSESLDRPLVFVGDGVNDAPVLTAADVGIALGARGSTAASESADMVIMTNDLRHVATALTISRQTFRIAIQSILIGIGLSVVLMIIFATGKFPPLAGAILQEVVDIFVIFNALRAHLITVND